MTQTHTERLVRVVPLVFLTLFFVVPTSTLFGAHLDVAAVREVVSDRSIHRVAWFSLWQGAASTAATLAIGLPATWAVTRWRFTGSRALAVAIGVPFLMPAVVMATGVAAVLPSRGVPAIVWAHVAFNISVVVRVVGPTWALLDRNLENSAASLGAGGWRVFRFVTWPAINEAVRNAAALVFVFCSTSFAVVSILGGARTRTIETEIFIRAVRLGSPETATALAVLQAVVVVAVLGLARTDGGSISSSDAPVPPGLSSRIRFRFAPAVVAATAATITCTPLVAVAVRSVRYGRTWNLSGWSALGDGTLDRVGLDTIDIATTTLVFATVAALVTVLLALGSCSRTGPGLVERISLAPLLVSSVTLGLGLVVTFDESPFEWRGRPWLIPIVHSVVALPLAVRIIGPALRTISTDLAVTAADLGAGPLRRWWTITLPLLRPALVRAAGMAAAVSVGEFGATSFLTRSGSTTVSIAIGDLMGRPGPVLQQAAFAITTVTGGGIVLGAVMAGLSRPGARSDTGQQRADAGYVSR